MGEILLWVVGFGDVLVGVAKEVLFFGLSYCRFSGWATWWILLLWLIRCGGSGGTGCLMLLERSDAWRMKICFGACGALGACNAQAS